jgi:hypothetical protein
MNCHTERREQGIFSKLNHLPATPHRPANGAAALNAIGFLDSLDSKLGQLAKRL